MPLVEEINVNEGKILCWEILESLSELESLWGNKSEGCEEIPTHPLKRKQFYASRILLHYLQVQDVFYKDTEGRPMLFCNKGDISLSHTDRYAVAYYHPYKKVGVDIECISEKTLLIKKKFMSEKEQMLLQHLSHREEPKKIATLFWCVKEALYKYVRRSAIHFSQHLHIENVDIPKRRIFTKIKHPVQMEIKELLYVEKEDHYLVYTI